MSNKIITIAIVGDVHDQWEYQDHLALAALSVDLVLFVGDFGNESVPVVEAIASLPIPKAVIMGNHDAWYTASDWGRKKCPYDFSKEDRVQQQLDLLGDQHVGYSWRDFPELDLSVVGSRPFSWGGDEWKNIEFYQQRYNVSGFTQSTERIVTAAKSARYSTVIFLGHNGPFGLGDRACDPCGRDWKKQEGDHGDVDFASAIATIRHLPKHIPLVTFGHMHHKLRKTEVSRTPLIVDSTGTVYLNAAHVPRIVQTEKGICRNFFLVTLAAHVVADVSLVWVDPNLQIASKTRCATKKLGRKQVFKL